jgi:hypothetical protein
MLITPLFATLLAGCGGEEPKAPPQAGNQNTEPINTEAAPPPPKLDLAAMQAEAQQVALVPSPAEMQRALEKAGIATGLSAMVPARNVKMDVQNKDVIAVRTGVVLADCLLTVKDAPKEKLVERLETVKTGLTALGAGADLNATVDDLVARIKNDGVTRDDLVKELDEMHGAIIPEIKYEAGEQVVPLIQAGSWLAGSNLVSAAIAEANNVDAGTQLLRQPQVADYFLKYVQSQGEGKAPDAVIAQLDGTLKKLKEIAVKPALTLDDVKEVKSQTDAVLALL